ncbi:MAG: hypothetical protein E7E92_04025 [Clostridiales bacterium]|uniref:hypothetical protein n=1 Tax=Intestinibacter bartlettii TaxID=261299 RepID=UPI0029011D0D|nr:hypothetical protein [Clostridiales bacterium]
MRKVKFIQTIVVLLITIFIFNIMEPLCNTYAEINSEKENKNLVIINDDIDNFIYTYTKNNIKYMVKENSTKDYKHIYSEIYMKNESNKYNLIETRTFDMSNTEITNKIKDSKTQKIKVEKDNISELIESENNGINKINKLNNFSLNNFKMLDEARISRTKIETTNWKYSQTLKTSSKIKKYTLLAVTAVITTAVTYSFLGPVGSAAANGISVIAQAIISDNIPNVWITHVFYLKFMSGTYMAVGEKKVTSVYKNSARTKRIKSPVTTYYWN